MELREILNRAEGIIIKPGAGVVSEPAKSESKPDAGVVSKPEKSQNRDGSGVS